ncbi:MAG: efflux transporter outer membrane subunit [Mariniblastus sp.]|nr:efflux transporter outer membrane subunit [Mariniblastus sp.]
MFRVFPNPRTKCPSGDRRRPAPFLLGATLLALAGLTLTGCTSLQQWCDNGFKVGPNYCRPPATVSDFWLDVHDPRVSQDGSDFADWWSVFEDPVLDGLILNAYQQNLTLREAGFRVLQAQATRDIAAGEIMPQVQQFNGTYSRTQLSTNNLLQKIPNIPRSFDHWLLGFNASWELDIWGRFRRMVEAADAELDASVSSYDAILTSLIAEVAMSYVEIRTYQQQLEYTRANIVVQEKSLELSQNQFDAGATDQVSVEFARANLEETRSMVPQLETELRTSANRLCVLLGVPPRELGPILGLQPVPQVPSDVAVGIPADLIRRRPDIRAAERMVAARCAEVGVAESELYPAFYINGDISVNSRRINQLFSGDSVGGVISPGFQWNILNYGRLVNNVAGYDAELEQSVAAYQQTVLEAAEEVENGLNGFLNAQDQYEAYRKSTEANLRALDLVTIQFREGEVDFTPIYVLQNNIVSQQIEMIAAQSNIALELIALYKALGGGWQIRCYLDQKNGVITDGFQGLPTPTSGPIPELQDSDEKLPIPSGQQDDEAPNQPPLINSVGDLSEADLQRLAVELLKQLRQMPTTATETEGKFGRPSSPSSLPAKTTAAQTRIIDHRNVPPPVKLERLSDEERATRYR